MKKIIKLISLGLVILLGIGAGFYYLTMPFVAEGVEITTSEAKLYFTEKGIVENKDQMTVYPLVSGKITEIIAKEDEYIEAGEPICKIDSKNTQLDIDKLKLEIESLEAQKSNLDLEEKRQRDTMEIERNALLKEQDKIDAQSETSTGSKEEQLKIQQILIDQNENDIKRLTEEVEKGETLFASGVISQKEYDEMKDQLKTLETGLESNKKQYDLIEKGSSIQDSENYFNAAKDALNQQINDLNSAMNKSYTSSMKQYYDIQISSLEIEIDKLNDFLIDSTITSPESGYITELYAKNSNIISQGSPIAILSTGENLISSLVSTNDIDTIDIGDEVELMLKRRVEDKIYKGKVTSIGNEAVETLSSLGVEERKVEVLIEPTENKDDFKLGYDMDVRYLIYNEKDKITVPKTACFKDEDKDYIWLETKGKLEKKEITLGIELRAEYVIEEGLSIGNRIVKDASDAELKEGLKIKLR